MCRLTVVNAEENSNSGQVVLFPKASAINEGAIIDADSGEKYERGSEEYKAIIKFTTKPEYAMFADVDWLLEHSC